MVFRSNVFLQKQSVELLLLTLSSSLLMSLKPRDGGESSTEREEECWETSEARKGNDCIVSETCVIWR